MDLATKGGSLPWSYGILFAMQGLLVVGLICLGLAWQDRAFQPSSAVAEAFAGLGAAALFEILRRRPTLARFTRDEGLVFRVGLAWLLILFGTLVFVQASARIGPRRYFWLEDDAMVSMRYGARLAAGQGLTWTAGPPVEGYSNFLWTLLMALIHGLGSSRALASAWILALNAVCLVWMAQATRRLSRALGANALAASLAGLACALSYDAVAGALSGLEMVAVAAVMAEALARGMEAQVHGRRWPWSAFAWAGLLPLLRADGALPAALVLVLGLWGGGERAQSGEGSRLRTAWIAAALALGPGLTHELFRHAYYGRWVPNTYTLKQDYWPGKYQAGLWKLARDLTRYPLVLLALVWAGAVRAHRPALAVLSVLALYCVWVGEDYYPFLRFFAPGLPLFFALGFASGACLVAKYWGDLRAAGVVALMLLVSANAAWSFPTLLQSGWQGAQERVRVGLYLGRLVAPNESVASSWAGAFFYFSGVRGIDLLGKCDAVVAATKPDPSMGGSGHNKLDLDHSLGELKPNWVLLKAPSYSSSDRAYLVSTYDQRVAADPRFLAHCMPQLRQISDHWALCRCVWTNADRTTRKSGPGTGP